MSNVRPVPHLNSISLIRFEMCVFDFFAYALASQQAFRYAFFEQPVGSPARLVSFQRIYQNRLFECVLNPESN